MEISDAVPITHCPRQTNQYALPAGPKWGATQLNSSARELHLIRAAIAGREAITTGASPSILLACAPAATSTALAGGEAFEVTVSCTTERLKADFVCCNADNGDDVVLGAWDVSGAASDEENWL